jgi:hypothetical protein
MTEVLPTVHQVNQDLIEKDLVKAEKETEKLVAEKEKEVLCEFAFPGSC